MKKCPFCAEEIQDDAVKCKHCGEFLIDADLKGLNKNSNLAWQYKTPMTILWIAILGPFAIPFILKNPQYDNARKTIWVVVAIVFTMLIVLLFTAIIILYIWFIGQIDSGI